MEQSEASTVRVCALMTAVCWFHVMVNHRVIRFSPILQGEFVSCQTNLPLIVNLISWSLYLFSSLPFQNSVYFVLFKSTIFCLCFTHAASISLHPCSQTTIVERHLGLILLGMSTRLLNFIWGEGRPGFLLTSSAPWVLMLAHQWAQMWWACGEISQ